MCYAQMSATYKSKIIFFNLFSDKKKYIVPHAILKWRHDRNIPTSELNLKLENKVTGIRKILLLPGN